MKASWLASRILEQSASNPSGASSGQELVRRVSSVLRHMALAAGWDAPCRVRVAGLAGSIMLPLSHQMPAYRNRHPYYDRLIEEIADVVRKDQTLRMVDVGANVGDSILASGPTEHDAFLAFEPHPAFIAYLRENLADVRQVTVSHAACGSSDGSVAMGNASHGTAGATTADGGTQVALTSLDNALPVIWSSHTPNFVKIDTDGFDIDVIEGGRHLWRDARPWLLYEADSRLTRGGVSRHLEGIKQLAEAGYISALAFTNLGSVAARLRLDDPAAWRALLGSQSADGLVHYHDLLVAPSEEKLSGLIARLRAKRWPGAETSEA